MEARLALARTILVAPLALGPAGCHDEERRFHEPASVLRRPGSEEPEGRVPGPGAALSGNRAAPAERALLEVTYPKNAWAVSEGKRLFSWYNCNGCHSQGGGGMGPALMDAAWRYGSAPRDIFDSIARGRKNGMPAFGARIPEQQVWQLVAYVRALGGMAPLAVRPSRSDALIGAEPESLQEPQTPVREVAPP